MSARLYQIVKDVPGHLWCGPAAIAAITGEPVSKVLYAAKRVTTRESIRRMWCSEIVATLHELGRPRAETFGFVGPYPTLAQWRKTRDEELHVRPVIAFITGHFIAVAGNRVVDHEFTDPIYLSDHPNQRKRVKAVIVPGEPA